MRLAGDWHLIDTVHLPRSDSLALDAAGQLRYVTLETRPGRLVELTSMGSRTVFGDFGEPDGLLVGAGTAIVTEEEPAGRVMAYDLREPQGIVLADDGSLYVAETRADRVLHLAPQ